MHHLKVKVVVVLGHEGCGAVKAAAQPTEALLEQPAELAKMLTMIKGGLEEERLAHINDARVPRLRHSFEPLRAWFSAHVPPHTRRGTCSTAVLGLVSMLMVLAIRCNPMLCPIHGVQAHDREAVVTNVRRQLEKLNKHELFAKRTDNGELIVIGAFYEISSGIVDFFY